MHYKTYYIWIANYVQGHLPILLKKEVSELAQATYLVQKTTCYSSHKDPDKILAPLCCYFLGYN